MEKESYPRNYGDDGEKENYAKNWYSLLRHGVLQVEGELSYLFERGRGGGYL